MMELWSEGCVSESERHLVISGSLELKWAIALGWLHCKTCDDFSTGWSQFGHFGESESRYWCNLWRVPRNPLVNLTLPLKADWKSFHSFLKWFPINSVRFFNFEIMMSFPILVVLFFYQSAVDKVLIDSWLFDTVHTNSKVLMPKLDWSMLALMSDTFL